jgi:hypothetical protein
MTLTELPLRSTVERVHRGSARVWRPAMSVAADR